MLAATNFALTLEAVAIILGVLVSLTVLLGLLVNFTNKIHFLEIKLQHLQQELIEHSNLEGHRTISDKLNDHVEYVHRIEKSLDLHIQDYINRKETVHFLLGQLDEKISHKFGRAATAIAQVQNYLEKDSTFKIRDPFSEAEKGSGS